MNTAHAESLWITKARSKGFKSVTGGDALPGQGHGMNEEPLSISPSLISLGGERPVHMAVDAKENVPLAPPADAGGGEERPLQMVDLDDLHASIDVGRLPDAQG